jgi:CP family cyanate transporter-like MFS transporter
MARQVDDVPAAGTGGWLNRQTLGPLSMSWLTAVNLRAPLVATGAVLPLMRPALHLDATVAGLLTALPLLLMAVLSLPGGALADRLGARRVLALSQLVTVVGGAVRAAATGAPVLLGAVALLGAAIGIAQPALARVAQAVARARATQATTVYANGLVLGGLFGSALSVPVLLPLAGPLGWRGVFLEWAVLGVLAAAGWELIRVPEPEAAPQVSAHRVPTRPMPGMVPFMVTFAAQSAMFYGLATWLPSYFLATGWHLAAATLVASVVSVGSVPGGLMAPPLTRRWGGFRRPIVGAGLAAAAAGFGLWLWPTGAFLWTFVVGAMSALVLTVDMAAPAVLSPPERVGRDAGLLLTVGYGGAVIGPLAIGVLRDLTGGYGAGLAFLGLTGLLWAVAGLRVPAGVGRSPASLPG